MKSRNLGIKGTKPTQEAGDWSYSAGGGLWVEVNG